MNIKKYLLASLAAYLFIFIFEWGFHGVFLKPTYEATQSLWRNPEDCIYSFMITGQILLPLILGFVFLRNYENKGIMEGARFGFLMGLIFVPHHLIMYAVAPYPLSLTISWIIGGFFEMICIGCILALVYRPVTS